MNQYEPGISYPRRRDDWVRDHPLASRLLIMIVGFAVLVPIGLVIRASQGNVVRSGGLPGAALAADPLIVASSTTTAAPDAAASTVPAVSSSSAVASTDPPSTAAVAAAEVAATADPPATTAAKKVTTTTDTPATTAAKKAAATTAAPKPTNPPSTKAPATTHPPTTPAPTDPPTTEAVVAPPQNTYSKADVEAIIRSVFPPEEADEAVRIATRESNLVPTVRNWCCYGLFQVYFKMNKKVLAAIGVTAPEQLYDPVVNTQAAYAIFQRSGWAPWR
jgi:hypothetical protein